MSDKDKGLDRGGTYGQEGEFDNKIAPEGSLNEAAAPTQRGGSASVPQGGQPGNALAQPTSKQRGPKSGTPGEPKRDS